jgi:hypothetical protein
MTEEHFSIRVRIGNCEIELSGKKDEVMATLDELSRIVETVSKSFKIAEEKPRISSLKGDAERSDIVEPTEVSPTIPRPSGPSDAIMNLLSTEWGRTPRIWQEINEALVTNAIYYSKGSITGTLTNLTKKNKLRRIRTEKGYSYILT